jgi:hypothetical protein
MLAVAVGFHEHLLVAVGLFGLRPLGRKAHAQQGGQ